MQDRFEKVTVDQLRAGDTVVIDGIHKTVCAKDLGRDELLGATLWGDSYKSGHDTVTRVTYAAEIMRQRAIIEV